MESYQGTAVIAQGAVEVSVHCDYEEFDDGSGLTQWLGSYLFPDPAHRLDTGGATLVLPDGRKAAIILTRVNHRNGDETGEFQGAGDLPS